MIDCNFPIITYPKDKSYREWGQYHGESYREAIKELAEIRKNLMLTKNPKLKNNLTELATEQWNFTKSFSLNISEELEGITMGSGLSIEDIVILNNYTDFRDIELPEEGCSTAHIQRAENILSGQTWDMHGSAKNYVCVINLPEVKNNPGALIFSLVGCVGMMGYNTKNCMVGVNNINTLNARSGIKWPALIRKLLEQHNKEDIVSTLTNAPVTSGHNYLITSPCGGENWEVTPEVSARVSQLKEGDTGHIFHTNHCLSEKLIPLEQKESLSSTTHPRYRLLEKKIQDVSDLEGFEKLLTDHEEHPKSICSHYESNAQDPSFTCGGAIGDMKKENFIFWRGCPQYDANFVEHKFKISGGSERYFEKI